VVINIVHLEFVIPELSSERVHMNGFNRAIVHKDHAALRIAVSIWEIGAQEAPVSVHGASPTPDHPRIATEVRGLRRRRCGGHIGFVAHVQQEVYGPLRIAHDCWGCALMEQGADISR
jgi:hypothetical protein